MRLYTFVNYYLSPIQHGIQTAHVVSELFAKYHNTNSVEHMQLLEWAKNHKTIIVLNGGNNESLKGLNRFFGSDDRFASVAFYEDDESLAGIMTAVGILLPESIYNEMEKLRLSKSVNPYLSYEDQLMVQTVSNYRLA